MWHFNSGALSALLFSVKKNTFYVWHISDNMDNKVRKRTIILGVMSTVFERLECLWSLQLFFWKHYIFCVISLLSAKTNVYFDTNQHAFEVLELWSGTIALNEKALYCPWPLTSTISICSFLFSVVPVDNQMWWNLNTIIKKTEWKVNIQFKIKICLPYK